ncbi:MAG: hypothetical protein MET45_29115 [Nostoc sp. LLA-1]|nr:hypothetical protein [Cyanocohniella sp. LLY]
MLKNIDNWLNLIQTSFDYQLLLSDILMRTFEELVYELKDCQIQDDKLGDLRQLIRIWSRIFDQKFADKLRLEDAVLLQGKLLNTVINYLPHQQELSKEFVQFLEILGKINLINIFNYLGSPRLDMLN